MNKTLYCPVDLFKLHRHFIYSYIQVPSLRFLWLRKYDTWKQFTFQRFGVIRFAIVSLDFKETYFKKIKILLFILEICYCFDFSSTHWLCQALLLCGATAVYDERLVNGNV